MQAMVFVKQQFLLLDIGMGKSNGVSELHFPLLHLPLNLRML